MSETNTNKYIQYTHRVIDIGSACIFWTAVLAGLYAGHLYHNVYKETCK